MKMRVVRNDGDEKVYGRMIIPTVLIEMELSTSNCLAFKEKRNDWLIKERVKNIFVCHIPTHPLFICPQVIY